jgi:hypothetical protein
MTVGVQQITGTAHSVANLLGNNRFGLDFYQREYSWEETQVGELIDDLSTRFEDEFDKSHERREVASYRPYFLGPIVTAQRDGVRYLVDGQQRITTLSLLLMHLRRITAETDSEAADGLDPLIFSTSYGAKTFNLDIDERKACLTSILEGRDFDTQNEPESVRNLWDRYLTIVDRFPENLQGTVLPYFIDWLQHRVILVDIGAPDQNMALEIFETMNDRGLRLSNTDMLKSFLLSKVGDQETIQELNEQWRRRIVQLTDAETNADTEFAKAWLRGDYAETQRERKQNASPGDFDIIGTAFHKWVRDNSKKIGLIRESDFKQFVEKEFLGLSARYLELLKASQELRPGMEAVHYNARTGFTFQLPVILAAITSDDDDETFQQKTALVAGALDIFVVRRMVNFRNFGYSTVAYTMFNLMKEVRNQPIEAVADVLGSWLENETERLEGIQNFSLTQRNRKHIHYLLARMTTWLDAELGNQGTFTDYTDRGRRHPFEVEHIWADHFERHEDEFSTSYDFDQHRNKFGDLVLLPKDFNASYGDMPYINKVEHYYGQNTLARSLHPQNYQNNPSFIRLCNSFDLDFKAYPSVFRGDDIDARQALYQTLAEKIWAPSAVGLG